MRLQNPLERVKMMMRWKGPSLAKALALIFSVVAVSTASAEWKAPSDPIVVEQGRTAIYKALAQLTVQSLAKGDHEGAVLYAKILENVWDRAADNIPQGVADDIDDAMDILIAAAKTPDPKDPVAAIMTAYNGYVKTLDAAK